MEWMTVLWILLAVVGGAVGAWFFLKYRTGKSAMYITAAKISIKALKELVKFFDKNPDEDTWFELVLKIILDGIYFVERLEEEHEELMLLPPDKRFDILVEKVELHIDNFLKEHDIEITEQVSTAIETSKGVILFFVRLLFFRE
jgi:hypothetical protein